MMREKEHGAPIAPHTACSSCERARIRECEAEEPARGAAVFGAPLVRAEVRITAVAQHRQLREERELTTAGRPEVVMPPGLARRSGEGKRRRP